MIPIEEIRATAVADKQAGVERLMCGCVLDGRGIVGQACPVIAAAISEGMELLKMGFGIARHMERVRAVEEAIKKHVRDGRAAIRKAKVA